MNAILKPISYLALAATLVPAVLYLTGTIDHAAVKWSALVGTVLWFATCPLWMREQIQVDADHVEI